MDFYRINGTVTAFVLFAEPVKI